MTWRTSRTGHPHPPPLSPLHHRMVSVCFRFSSRPRGAPRPPPLNRVLVAKGASGPRLQGIVALCRELSVPLRFEPRDALDRSGPSARPSGSNRPWARPTSTWTLRFSAPRQPPALLDGRRKTRTTGRHRPHRARRGLGAVLVPERRAGRPDRYRRPSRRLAPSSTCPIAPSSATSPKRSNASSAAWY